MKMEDVIELAGLNGQCFLYKLSPSDLLDCCETPVIFSKSSTFTL